MKALLWIILAATLFTAAACGGSRNIVRNGNVPVQPTMVDTVPIVDFYETQPVFDGDASGKRLLDHAAKNMRYLPEFDDYTGRVHVQLIVETDGTVSNERVVRGLHPALDAEVIRVIRLTSGMWTPGMLGCKPVRMVYNYSVKIILQ